MVVRVHSTQLGADNGGQVSNFDEHLAISLNSRRRADNQKENRLADEARSNAEAVAIAREKMPNLVKSAVNAVVRAHISPARTKFMVFGPSIGKVWLIGGLTLNRESRDGKSMSAHAAFAITDKGHLITGAPVSVKRNKKTGKTLTSSFLPFDASIVPASSANIIKSVKSIEALKEGGFYVDDEKEIVIVHVPGYGDPTRVTRLDKALADAVAQTIANK